MIHSKAIDVLKTFTKEELKQFSDFVRSPFFNKNKNLIKLFDVLEKYHPEFDAENEKVYSNVYTENLYHHDNLKKLMSEMLRLLDNFLCLTGMKKEKFTSERFILQELLTRNLDDYFLLHLKNYEKEYSGKRNLQFLEKSSLEDLRIDYCISRNKGIDTTELSNKKFIYDTCYFLFQIFEYLNSVTSHKNTYNNENINSKLFEFIGGINFDPFLNEYNPESDELKFPYLLCNLIKMILEPEDERYFFQAMKIFMSYLDSDFSENSYDLMAYFAAFSSYCARRRRKKELKYISVEFELNKYRFLTINKFDYNAASVSWVDFANAVNTGLYMNEIQWVEEFIVKSKKHIYCNDYEYLYDYGKGSVEFHNRNFEKALEHFSKIHFKEHLLNITIRQQILMCYYELDLFEVSISGIDSFNHHLQ